MAELIKNANGPADKITSPEKPAKEAPRLTIKDVAALGFDNELIRFAILQTDGCIWNAVDVLLRVSCSAVDLVNIYDLGVQIIWNVQWFMKYISF